MKRLLPALVLLAGSCGGSAPLVASSGVTLVESSITVESPRFVAGEVTLLIGNAGEFSHTLVVTDDAGVVLAATGLVAPGEEVTMTVDLLPGAYQFSCRIVASGGDGRVFDHYQMGMVARVVAEGGSEAVG